MADLSGIADVEDISDKADIAGIPAVLPDASGGRGTGKDSLTCVPFPERRGIGGRLGDGQDEQQQGEKSKS